MSVRTIADGENNKVLYFHINPIKNEIFYVGIGTEKRPYLKNDRSIHWGRIVSKYGYIVNIIETNLSWEQACEKEKLYIQKIGRRDLKTGTLINLTDGGSAMIGLSLESRNKISEKHKGNHYSPNTEFKKGISVSPSTQFKKGSIPSNKGKGTKYGITIICKNCKKEYIRVKNKGAIYCSKKCQGGDIEFRNKISAAISCEERENRRKRMFERVRKYGENKTINSKK